MSASIIKLRFLAILGVLMIHVSAPFLHEPFNYDWYVGNFFDSISRFCVPLFLMISGALLLNKDESINRFLSKRTSKIVLPFVAWSIFYYMFKRDFVLEDLNFKDFLRTFLEGGIHYHLWYLYLIIPIYLLIPVLRKLVKTAPTSVLLYYVVLAFLMSTMDEILIDFFSTESKLYFTGFSSYIGYVILGYLIYHRNLFSEYKIYVYIVGLIGLLVTYFGTSAISLSEGEYQSFFYNYYSLNVLVITFAIMTFVCNLPNKTSLITRKIADYSFGIYFVHPIFIGYFKPLFNQTTLGPISYIFLLFLSVLITSFCFSLVMSKLPLLKKFQ